MIISPWILLRNVSDRNCKKNQNSHLCSAHVTWKSYHFWDNIKKYSSARQNTDNTARVLCILDTSGGYIHTACAILLLFNCNNGYTKAPRFYIICALPILFKYDELLPEIIVIHEVRGIKQKEQSKTYHTYSIIPLWLHLWHHLPTQHRHVDDCV
jgi:hypothetical protein